MTPPNPTPAASLSSADLDRIERALPDRELILAHDGFGNTMDTASVRALLVIARAATRTPANEAAIEALAKRVMVTLPLKPVTDEYADGRWFGGSAVFDAFALMRSAAPSQPAGSDDGVVRDLRKALKLMEHKVVTCGVAASHPDPALTLRDDYMKWTSPQADEVRKVRTERDAAIRRAEAAEAKLAKAAICGSHTWTQQEHCPVCDANRSADVAATANHQAVRYMKELAAARTATREALQRLREQCESCGKDDSFYGSGSSYTRAMKVFVKMIETEEASLPDATQPAVPSDFELVSAASLKPFEGPPASDAARPDLTKLFRAVSVALLRAIVERLSREHQ